MYITLSLSISLSLSLSLLFSLITPRTCLSLHRLLFLSLLFSLIYPSTCSSLHRLLFLSLLFSLIYPSTCSSLHRLLFLSHSLSRSLSFLVFHLSLSARFCYLLLSLFFFLRRFASTKPWTPPNSFHISAPVSSAVVRQKLTVHKRHSDPVVISRFCLLDQASSA